MVSLLLLPPPEHERTRARDELGPRITALLFFFLLRFCFQLARFIRLTRRFFLALDNDTFFFSFFLFFWTDFERCKNNNNNN